MANPFQAADAALDRAFSEAIVFHPMVSSEYGANSDDTRPEHACRGVITIVSDLIRPEGAARYDGGFPSLSGEIARVSVREVELGAFVPRQGDVIAFPDRTVANRVRVHAIDRDGQGRVTLRCVATPGEG